MEQNESPRFEPSNYLMKLKGKDYLEVKYRLVWFNETHPEGSIVTELVSHTIALNGKEDTSLAVFKATVTFEVEGSLVYRTGYGMEERGDFGDYLEKAETKAIGRALAVSGFGTQFCDDLDFGGSEGRVVDAPVARPVKGVRSKLQPVPRG